jgi:hypothetical protein
MQPSKWLQPKLLEYLAFRQRENHIFFDQKKSLKCLDEGALVRMKPNPHENMKVGKKI